MATGYRIEIGYISGHSNSEELLEIWDKLRLYAKELAEHPDIILQEARRFWKHEDTSALEEVCKTYSFPIYRGGPMSTTHEDAEDSRKTGHIFISASGAGRYREAKEHAARAFCRLCMVEMHKHGIEVCINVG